MTVQPSTLAGSPSTVFYNIGACRIYYSSCTINSTGWYNLNLNATTDTVLFYAITGGVNWFAIGYKELTELLVGYEAYFWGSQDGASKPYIEVTYTEASGSPGSWIGVTSTDWNTGSNWGDGLVPTSSVNVTIPDAATTPFDPTFSVNAVCNNITIEASGIVNGGTGTLTIYGNWSNSGTLNAQSSNVIFAGTADQIIGGASQSNFNDITHNKPTGRLILNRNIGVAGELKMLYPASHLLDIGTYKIDFTP